MALIETVANQIVDASLKVHRTLGPGLFETVYERVLAYELAQRSLEVKTQVPVPIRYENHQFEEAFRADLIVENLVLVEIKSLERLQTVHRKQVLTYMRLGGYPLGFLINFGESMLKDGLHRLVNRLVE